MLVIYEMYKNDRNIDDEKQIWGCDSLKEAKYFFENKLDTKTSTQNISKIIKNKGLINKKYRVFKIKD